MRIFLLINYFSATFAHLSFFCNLLFTAICYQNKISDDGLFCSSLIFLQLLLITHVFCNLLLAQLALKIGDDLFHFFSFYHIFFTFVFWVSSFFWTLNFH